MIKHDLMYGWKLIAPEQLSVLTNAEGLVAIVSNNSSFGDIQSLILTLSDTDVTCGTTPHYIYSVSVALDKTITIQTSPFFEQQLEEMEKLEN
ncbi:hypothetical protein [Vagococcus silagei]|uniref:Uncharacterized protein n=1 Tax=Vagococcus silagei TaxID=2508885 RepID=A0A4S3B133_9ENTE|nr:hypothetical protein [Vagococcus silagei]THB60118.1 hypothetical protein ESZ54_12060 [Vagococcus silagei]